LKWTPATDSPLPTNSEWSRRFLFTADDSMSTVLLKVAFFFWISD
jgi:hypothetical protein